MLSEYLQRTQGLRLENCNQLFIGLHKPHGPVSSSTIHVARWVNDVMSSAGLDMTTFTPHSIRAASTSAAAKSGVPMDIILATAGWSRENTFRKYYQKPVTEQTFNVQKQESSSESSP